MAGNGPVSAKNDPVANEVMNRLSRLADMAEGIASRASEQLHPVCQEDRPMVTKGEEGCTVEREYPPLFNDMRTRMNTIENAFRRLGHTLDRCEV